LFGVVAVAMSAGVAKARMSNAVTSQPRKLPGEHHARQWDFVGCQIKVLTRGSVRRDVEKINTVVIRSIRT
jgi:hypothetical protein